jgi:hypothetical protein
MNDVVQNYFDQFKRLMISDKAFARAEMQRISVLKSLNKASSLSDMNEVAELADFVCQRMMKTATEEHGYQILFGQQSKDSIDYLPRNMNETSIANLALVCQKTNDTDSWQKIQTKIETGQLIIGYLTNV